MAGLYLGDNRLKLTRFVFVNPVRQVLPDHRLVGWHDRDLQAVNFEKFLNLGRRRAGHAGELGVEAEVVLKGNGRERPALTLDFDALFGFDRLVEALAVAPAQHQPAGELVNDDDLAVLDYVVAVALVQGVGPQGLLDVVNLGDAAVGVDVFYAEQLFHLGDTRFGQGGRTHLLVNVVVFVFLQPGHKFSELAVLVG